MALSVIDPQNVRRLILPPRRQSGKRDLPSAALRHPAGIRGFTLIEMMVALIILSVSILALTTLTIADIQANHQNDLRNTAVKVTSEVAEILLTQPIDTIVSGGLSPYNSTNAALSPSYTHYPNPVQRIKGGNQTYTATWTATSLTTDLTQIAITVAYTYRGQQRTNSAVVYKHRAI